MDDLSTCIIDGVSRDSTTGGVEIPLLEADASRITTLRGGRAANLASGLSLGCVARASFPIDRIIRGPAGLHDCAYRTRKVGGTQFPLGGATHRAHRLLEHV